MEPDYMSRGYLLPPGCKDLIDVLKLKAVPQLPVGPASFDFSKLHAKSSLALLDQLLDTFKKSVPKAKIYAATQGVPQGSAALPPIAGQIVIPAETSVSKLAELLGQQATDIINDVMVLGFFVTPEDPLSFEIISSVARKHGFMAIKAAA